MQRACRYVKPLISNAMSMSFPGICNGYRQDCFPPRLRSFHNRINVDAAELDRIAAALKAAIAEARVLAAADPTIGPEVREIIRSAREMHDLYVEALLTNEPLATAQYRGVADSTGNAIDELDALVARADGKVN